VWRTPQTRHACQPDCRERLATVAVLLLAALLRIGWLGITEFKLDEARLVSASLELARGKGLPLVGNGSSTGLPTAPPGVYVYALPILAWASLLFATWFTAALHVLAVALCWCKHSWDLTTGRTCASIYYRGV
jgi:hypothetical protein